MRARLLPMLLTGLFLAVLLLGLVQYTQSRNNEAASGQTETEAGSIEAFDPVIVRSVSESAGVLYISGEAEAETPISIQNSGSNIRQIKSDQDGLWNVSFPVDRNARLNLEMVEYVEGDVAIRSEETIFRIPPPPLDEASGDQSPEALLMLTAPGGPSRIFQSPFRGLPTSGSVTMGSIDYDGSGGVIFSGTSSMDGRIRLYANNTRVGERRVSAEEGRWYFIAADTLPSGKVDVKAQLITEQGIHSEVTVPFERLTNSDSDEVVRVFYEPYSWQIRRRLIGGGIQYTAIFAPEGAEAIIQQ